MKQKYSKQSKGMAALALLALVFASMGIFARSLSADLGLFQQVYSRLFLAFIFSAVLFNKHIRWNKVFKIPLREWGVLLSRSTFTHLLGVVLVTAAVLNTKLGVVSFIQTLPIVALLGVIFLKEQLTTAKTLLIILASIGVFILTVHNGSGFNGFGRGEVFSILAAVAFAFGYISRHWHRAGLNNQEITTVTFFISTVIIFIASLIAGEGLPTFGSYEHHIVVVALIGSGLFNVVNLFLSNYGFEHVKAVTAGNILTLEALFGVILGFVFYSEKLTGQEYVGGILIVLSVILMNNITHKENVTPE